MWNIWIIKYNEKKKSKYDRKFKKSWNYENIANCYSIVFYNFLTLMMMLQNIDVLFFQVDQIIIFL